MSKLSAHSEVGKLRSVLMKRPEEGFISQDKCDAEWQGLNFLSVPDFDDAVREHAQLVSDIGKDGVELHYLSASENLTMDSVYCRDAAIVTDFGVILCNMGKQARKEEPIAEQKFFEDLGMDILGTVTNPGTIEGGDVAWLDEKTLAIGHTYRTNYEGIDQMKSLLEPHGIEILVAELPHYKGESDVFHLMSILSPVDYKKAVIYSPLMPIHFRNELLKRDWNLIEVPDEEFELMGCNVLAIAPGECIMVDGCPITKSRIEAAGCSVQTYKGNEISVKGGGGPTCLTRPILREIL